MAKRPWYARLDGGEEAIERARAYSQAPALRNIWNLANRTRLKENPDLFSAVSGANVPYGVARRLDVAYQSENALKSKQILDDAGIPASQMDPRITTPAQAGEAARKQKIKAQEESGGNWFTNLLQPISSEASPLNSLWEAGKGAVETIGTGLQAASSILTSPLAAGQADRTSVQEDVVNSGGVIGRAARSHAATAVAGPGVLGSIADFGVGAYRLVTGDVSDEQKEDMRRGGYDPDSFSDRYGWYTDLNDPHERINEQAVSEAKQEFNPYKVDLAREIVASGAVHDQSRVAGLPGDAQKLFNEIRQGADKEGGAIIEKLLGRSNMGPGANIADQHANMMRSVGVEVDRDSSYYKGMEAVGDLAAYWYMDPLVGAAGALKLWRNGKWMTDFEPAAIKDAIVNRPSLARRYDAILDSVDKIHVLGQSKRVEDQVAAAKETSRFQQKYADMMPFFDTLLGMRRGSITGAFFREPDARAKLRDVADLKSNMIGIERVDDPAKYKPIFALRNNPADEVAEEARTEARAAIADRIGDAIMADAVLSGRPLIKNKLVLPGEIRLSYPLRAATRAFSEKAFRESGLLFKQLRAAEGKGVIDWAKADSADAAVSGVIDSAKGGDFIRDNYTRGGLRSKAAYALSRFAVVRDRATLKLDGLDTTKTYHDFVRFLLPRGQSAFLASQWAKADPAQRSVMLNNTFEMLANARHARDTKAGQDFWDQALKGRESVIRPGEPVKEAYSTPATDRLRTPAGDITAAMYSTQFADGVKLPSFLDIHRNTEAAARKVGVLSWLSGLSNSEMAARATRIVKIGQVGTTSNLLRQAYGEARPLQFLENPTGAVRVTLARMGLAGKNAAERAEVNQAVRQAHELRNSGANKEFAALYAGSKFDEVATRASELLKGEASPVLTDLLASGAKLEDISHARSQVRLAATRYGGVDWLRRKRANLYAGLTDKTDTKHAYEWFDKVDASYAEQLENAAHKVIGGNRAHYMDGALVDDLEQIDEGLKAGHRLSLVKLANTQGHLGAAGDVGAMRWSNALGQRLADPVGGKVLRATAEHVLRELNTAKRVSAARERASKAYAKANDGAALSDDALSKVEALARAEDLPLAEPLAVAQRLLKEAPEGQAYRLEGRRAQYHDGRYIAPDGDRTLALNKWAEDMTADAAHYLGLATDAARRGDLSAEHVNVLTKIARGDDLEPDDLARVADEFRPDTVQAPIVVGKRFVESTENLSEKVAAGATKFYQFVVAKPLHRIVNDPQTVAAHREIMDAMEPLAKALSERGMSHQSIYDLLQTGAYGHAINRVTRYSDNPNVTSYFAALSNNFLWYERAMEDFLRRAMRVSKADPAVFARAHLMTEAGLHSGLINREVMTDDDGTQKVEYVFTYPGSGLLMRAVNESLQALGIGDGVKVPVWQDFTSPVKYLSPSLQNPLGFTTTPLAGLPLRVTKDLFPQTAPTIDDILTTIEGGERFFGSQGYLESLLPVHGKRLWNMLDPDDRTSQFMSSYRNALVYYQAAGLLPGPEASAAERQRAMDDVATMVQNNLAFRTAIATFAPATPGTFGSNISGIGDGEVNAIDAARGVTTIRGEWFQLLEEYSKKNADSNQAYSEAMAEWTRRGHGSILNPEAFTVGSSGQPGDQTGRSFASNKDLAQWMLSNRDFIDKYGEVAYTLLPDMAGPYYDQIGYRLQLKNELRQHKTGSEFYDAMVAAMAWRDYNQATLARDEALRQGHNPDRVKNWFQEYTRQLEAANPIWAEARGRTSTPEYVAQHLGPALADLVRDENLPAEYDPHISELRLMSQLYDEYQSARGRAPSRQERINLAVRYGQAGDSLFKDGPLNDLWSRMKVWED